ncbi:10531_t:CDS:2, partial [Entrophospora sp. SA101]
LIQITKPLKEVAEPSKLLFHQFEPYLVAANKDAISVWNWKDHYRVNTFTNDNPGESKITALKFINEDDASMLLTGSSDGVVRIFRNYSSSSSTELVTSWRAMPEILPNSTRSGLIAEWQQSRGILLVGGDDRVIRVWDALREITVSSISTRSGSSITSLTSDGGDLFAAGYADGAVRLFDRRIQPRDALIMTSKEHKNFIINIVWQRGAGHKLVSGSKSGEIKLWDLRNNCSKVTISDDPNKSELNAMDVHHNAEVVAG